MVLAWRFVGAIIEINLGWWASATRNLAVPSLTGVDMFFVLSGYFITRILFVRAIARSWLFLRERNTPDLPNLLSAGRNCVAQYVIRSATFFCNAGFSRLALLPLV